MSKTFFRCIQAIALILVSVMPLAALCAEFTIVLQPQLHLHCKNNWRRSIHWLR